MFSAREILRGMPEGNVELYRQITDAFSRRDLDAFLALSHPEVEIRPRSAALEGGDPYRGHDGVRKWWTNLLSVFPDFIWEIDDVRGLGDVTVARVRLRGHGMGSDAPMEQPTWAVVNWRDGRATWWGTFESEPEALEAAGLSE